MTFKNIYINQFLKIDNYTYIFMFLTHTQNYV